MVKYIISSGRKNKNYQQKINTDMKLIKNNNNNKNLK